MADLDRDIYWSPWEDPGLEHLHLTVSPDGVEALGLILRMREGRHFRCRYELQTDPEWRRRSLTFAVMPAGSGGPPKRVEIESDGQGNWRVDGERRADLAGCSDVDIQVSPFTNSLPIRRLGLAEGESAEISAAYLWVPELKVEADAQRYTRLEDDGAAGGRYRYDAVGDDFTAELPVDGDGLVMDYPDLFRRVWPL